MPSLRHVLALAVLAITGGYAVCLELEEPQATPGTWGYRPADGATEATFNPPGFVWGPSKQAVTYDLETAEDSGFQNIVYSKTGIRWSAHCPSSTLPAGKTLFWRYRARDAKEERTGWSRVRQFMIDASAKPMPQPELRDLLARLPEQHPRLFFRPEDVPKLRELAQGPLNARWQAIQKAADEALADPPDTTEPPLYPEGTKRLSETWKEIWWGNRARMIAVADTAATLGFAYQITGDEKYARGARDLLMALTKWDVNGSTQYAYNDEAAMPALYMASRAYSWAHPIFTESERAAIVSMMRARGEQCYKHLQGAPHIWKPYGSHSNRAWHFLGELAIAFHGDFPEADQWLDFAMTVYSNVYPAWGDSDGGWHEGVSYWTSYLERFMYWVLAVDAAFDIDVFERPFFNKTGYYGLYLMPPPTEHGGFGDLTPRRTSENLGGIMALLTSGSRNPHWKWYTEQVKGDVGSGYLGFLHTARVGTLEAKAPADIPASTCFRGVGLAVLNTDLTDGSKNVQLQFKSSPYGTQSHGYNANNSFHLGVHGKPMLISTGDRDVHGSPHHTQWMWDTRSCNAILVNHEGQTKHSASALGAITRFETSPEVDIVVGDATKSYPQLDKGIRRILFFKPHAIVIQDVLVSKEPSTFQWLAHAPGQFEIGEGGARFNNGTAEIEIRFLAPANLAVTQTNEFTPPPHDWSNIKLDEWHLTADSQEKSNIRMFVTVIVIDKAPVSAELQSIDNADAGYTLALDVNGRKWRVDLTSDEPKPLQVAATSTPATVTAPS